MGPCPQILRTRTATVQYIFQLEYTSRGYSVACRGWHWHHLEANTSPGGVSYDSITLISSANLLTTLGLAMVIQLCPGPMSFKMFVDWNLYPVSSAAASVRRRTEFYEMLCFHGVDAVDKLLYFWLQMVDDVAFLLQLSAQWSVRFFHTAQSYRLYLYTRPACCWR